MDNLHKNQLIEYQRQDLEPQTFTEECFEKQAPEWASMGVGTAPPPAGATFPTHSWPSSPAADTHTPEKQMVRNNT